MKQLYINGKQATLWQKVLLTLGTIGFLILIIPLGIGILAIGAVAAAVFYVYLYFNLKKLKQFISNNVLISFKKIQATLLMVNIKSCKREGIVQNFDLYL